MAYPPATYHGDTGEVSATHRPASTPPELVSRSGNTTSYLATGTATEGLFGLYRLDLGPRPSGPGPHFHRGYTESFFVLLGTVRIYDGRNWVDAAAGDFVHVPIGGVHGFRNESGAPVSLLIHFAPGAPREGYFEGLARWEAEGRPDDAAVEAFFRLHDNHWV